MKSAQSGYTLIELLVALIILAIIASVAVGSLQNSVFVSRTEETKAEMKSLAFAIAGDPSHMSNGIRTDYGYVGDIGALPTTLGALTTNPASFATWNGPYIQDNFAASVSGSSSDIQHDAWGKLYSYSAGGASLTSTGSGSSITRPIANSADDLLLNQVAVTITDLSGKSPGTTYDDSIRVLLTYPNGAGGTTTKQKTPSSGGWVQFDSIPIGKQTLTVIYTPHSDTFSRGVNVDPGKMSASHVQLYRDFPGSVGGGGGIIYVNNSDSLWESCKEISFWVRNTGISSVTISSLTLTWSSPTAYYTKIKWDAADVWESSNPGNGTGQLATFSPSIVIAANQSQQVIIENFKTNPTGGPNADMRNVVMSVLLSDGSSLSFTTDNTCN